MFKEKQVEFTQEIAEASESLNETKRILTIPKEKEKKESLRKRYEAVLEETLNRLKFVQDQG